MSQDRSTLGLDAETRSALWHRLIERIEDYAVSVRRARVAPPLDREVVRSLLDRFDFAVPMDPLKALDFVAASLWRFQVHTPHPRYFGLFNPAPATMSIAADALAAAFNPQLAAWSHNPIAVEIEGHLIRAFGGRFGYDPATTDGSFCSGGAEANHTALLVALARAFPEFLEQGARALTRPPVFYVSAEAHHSFLKAARLSGLGTAAARSVPIDADLRMRPEALEAMLHADRAAGLAPFMVTATAGTTSAGVIDPVPEVADIAAREGLWFHVDAAWGGAAVLAAELAPCLSGIERSDSVTFDAHKWLSVPMGAGMFLTRHPELLEPTFRIATGYMPKDAAGLPVPDLYGRSMQWSRRFIGLKLFLSLAVAGWDGYAQTVRHMTAMGNHLRARLAENGWRLVNQTPLPLACFVDDRHAEGDPADHLDQIVRWVVGSGRAWISTVLLANLQSAIRACITNHRTGPEDVDALVTVLNEAREAIVGSSS